MPLAANSQFHRSPLRLNEIDRLVIPIKSGGAVFGRDVMFPVKFVGLLLGNNIRTVLHVQQAFLV